MKENLVLKEVEGKREREIEREREREKVCVWKKKEI